MLQFEKNDYKDAMGRTVRIGPFIGTVMIGKVSDEAESACVAVVIGMTNPQDGDLDDLADHIVQTLDAIPAMGPIEALIQQIVKSTRRRFAQPRSAPITGSDTQEEVA